MSWLIAGCGDLGTEVGLRAAAAGHRVHGLRRSAHVLPEPIEPLAGDLAGDLPALPDDVEVVVFTAAPDRRDAPAYRRSYLDGPQRVLDALERAGAPVERILLVSSTAVYGVNDGSWVDETTPARPATTTGRILLGAEHALWLRRPDAISLRLTGIYGPGRTRLLEQVRDGRAVRPDPPVHANRVHRDDAAAAVIHLLEHVAEPAPCYLGVDDAPVDRGEVIGFLAGELGLPLPPTGPDQRTRGGDKRCSNRRLRATGFELTYPTYREGYRAVLAGQGVRHP
ncbi:MAG: NAD-dependent epimerase/dehydratase family protein [Nitriliruptoraceae bacterium]